MPYIKVRDVSLHVNVVGRGEPLLLMHGGPGADQWTLAGLRRCADQATLVFYDHRCNGRSTGAEVSAMTWENLTADAEALREALGFERWSVLGHSFGGHVALEYALRYPASLSSLALVGTAAKSRWAREHAAEVLAARGWPPDTVDLCRRWFTGEVEPKDMFRTLMRLGPAYYHDPSLAILVRGMLGGAWRTKLRPEALVLAGRHLANGWSVTDRLGEIRAPTLIAAGTSDFIFPPEAQAELARGIPHARLALIERAGHEPWVERPDAFFPVLRAFLATESRAPVPAASKWTDPQASVRCGSRRG